MGSLYQTAPITFQWGNHPHSFSHAIEEKRKFLSVPLFGAAICLHNQTINTMKHFVSISRKRNDNRSAKGWDYVVASEQQLDRIKQVAASSWTVPFTVRCYCASETFFLTEGQVANVLEHLPAREKQQTATLPFSEAPF